MQRDLAALADRHFDLLIVGGGIHGAWVAWDAALRGLSVALIDRGDFGHATSANSLKTVHGGLRYLRDGDLGLVRRMIRERRTLLLVAPHLVRPLPCLMPTYRSRGKRPELMAAALLLNDLAGYDRNRGLDPARTLPRSRILSRGEALELMPGLPREGLSGAALWYDAQLYSSERLTVAVVRSAVGAGAVVANYLRADSLHLEGGRVVGVWARDLLCDVPLAIRARLVVNAAGPWAGELLGPLAARRPPFRLSTAMNLITHQIVSGVAVGIPSPGKGRTLFLAPWRGYTLVGTAHAPYMGHPDADQATAGEIEHFVDEVNEAYPAAQLRPDDVIAVQRGILPAGPPAGASDIHLVRRGHVFDHGREQGVEGLLTAVGVKYTTARHVAEQVVDRALAKLGRSPQPCATHVTPLFGGAIDRFADFSQRQELDRPAELAPRVIRQLVSSYGAAYTDVLAIIREQPELAQSLGASAPVIGAEVVHAVRQEMAVHLTDVVLRRVGVGLPGELEPAALRRCAEIMARELSWSPARRAREVEAVLSTVASVATSLAANEAGGTGQLVFP